jgi:ribosome-binding factor A
MPRDFSRTRRVADVIQRELAQIIPRELEDPHLGMVTITAVEVSRDLSHAKVFVTFMDAAENAQEHLRALNRASGYLRHLLAREVKFRTTPELHFVHDVSVERGVRLSALIDAAVAADRRSSGDEEE